ncbi:MAG TPA: uroporphyrinogen decarboxylase family protein, partial [Anaerolineales bacterium]|nr:uroporphyrinogen decarboxylase family protein [Anaerolineales bacterium]
NARERFLAVMDFEPVSTIKWEFGYWAAAVKRWYQEGLERKYGIDEGLGESAGVHGGAAGWRIGRPLGKDVNEICSLDLSLQRMRVNNFISPLYEEEVLEDHEDWILIKNNIGILEKRSKSLNSLSAYLEGPVKTRDDWEKLKAERLNPTLDGRLPSDWEAAKQVYKNRAFPLALGGGQGFFGTPRFLFGEVQVLTAFYDTPDLMHQVLNDLTDFWIALYDQILDEVEVDLMMIWEDICYNRGPLISPKTFEEFILPPYKKFTSFLRSRGVKNMIVDTDGDIWKLLPLLVEGGTTGIYPFEVNAGMNVVEVRKEYPRLQILGGISRTALIEGKDAIDQELEIKIPTMLNAGGYIPYMDHLVPPEVSWENFFYYRTKLNDMIDQHPQ